MKNASATRPFCSTLLFALGWWVLLFLSSSSAADPAIPEYVEFLDPTEVFQNPPPTEIALGELLAESDFVAVVYIVSTFETPDCIGEVLRVKRMCAVRENWSVPGPMHPHVVRNADGDPFLISVGRPHADIFTHGEDFDNDAYNNPIFIWDVPYLIFGKVRPVTEEQAVDLQDSLPENAFDGDQIVSFEFNITERTPVRSVQGLRGIYPLFGLERMVDMQTELGFPGDHDELLRGNSFKYLLQTYNEADATPLVIAVNRLLEALQLEPQQAREALGALRENEDPVIAAAAAYLMEQEKLPQFLFTARVPEPVADDVEE